MTIRLLPQNLVNQIAAGEVVEKPASVVKELMENAIDAGATSIEVQIIDAGKSFISVSDNGCGMDKQSLEMCVLSHATSKLSSDNLFDIHTFGFRGEALPSIASISRTSIVTSNGTESWQLSLEGMHVTNLAPCNRAQGTSVEIRDLFFATPARLKFLKSDTTEAENCMAVFNRIALSYPKIMFTFYDTSKQKAHYAAVDDYKQRLEQIFGHQVVDNTFEIQANSEICSIRGFLGVPTFNKSSLNSQYFFVNNRYVKDKICASAVRSAYAGLVPQGRYAVAILYLDIPSDAVDVNAHPAKTEIRFKHADKIRYFIMSELKSALTSFGALKPTSESVNNFGTKIATGNSTRSSNLFNPKPILQKQEYKFFAPPKASSQVLHDSVSCESSYQANESVSTPSIVNTPEQDACLTNGSAIDLGNALYQIENTYIVSATDNQLFIIDQHAAAERITLEKLKHDKLDSQNLLLPEICAMTESQVELLNTNSELLLKFGIHFEKLAGDLVNVTAIPTILGSCDVVAMMHDIVEELSSFGDVYTISDKIHHILSTISCHGSLRAGRALSILEMNALLRQMENTSNVAQCCHGRPSYISFSVKDLNKFFERT